MPAEVLKTTRVLAKSRGMVACAGSHGSAKGAKCELPHLAQIAPTIKIVPLLSSTAIDLTLNNVLLEWISPVAPSTGGDIPWPRPHAENFKVQAMMDGERLTRRVEID